MRRRNSKFIGLSREDTQVHNKWIREKWRVQLANRGLYLENDRLWYMFFDEHEYVSLLHPYHFLKIFLVLTLMFCRC